MRAARLTVVLTVAALIAPALGVHASTFQLQHSRQGLDGDTYAFKLDPKDRLTIHSGSTISMNATFAEPREDAAVALALTDLRFSAFESVDYFAFQNPGETHIELLDGAPVGQEVEINDPDGPIREVQVTWFFVGDVTLSDDPWHVAVAVPGAETVDVELDLVLSEDLDLAGEGTAGSGATFGPEDFDGTAQVVTDGTTAAAGVDASATAPPGTRGFAVMFPFTGQGAGRYGVEAPGPRDDARTVVQLAPAPPPAAFVLAGPAGTYRHWVDAEAWDQSGLDGRTAVFFAMPVL